MKLLAPMTGLFGFLLASNSFSAPPAAASIEAGKPFPSLTLPSMEGGARMSVDQFRGKKLLLFVYASW